MSVTENVRYLEVRGLTVPIYCTLKCLYNHHNAVRIGKSHTKRQRQYTDIPTIH